MCDYSLLHVKSRPAKVGDKLTTRNFGTGTKGFAAAEDASVVVCVRPGTELSFTREIECTPRKMFTSKRVLNFSTAIFRQINKDHANTHHDALELPDGEIVLLTSLREGQQATVLQMPAEIKSGKEKEALRWTAHVG